jgi:tetratricopeptide (TPR) repeat protein
VSDDLFERYKEALRRGHVAARRGSVDEALTAYHEAATLVPDRTLPITSAAGVFARAGRLDEALAAYDSALSLAPADEAALAGRAETLAMAERRTDAALAFDELADVQEAQGRVADASDTAGRALDQAESKVRRRRLEEFAGVLRASNRDERAEAALERALRRLRVDAGTLEAESESALDRGDLALALERSLGAARSFDEARRPVAALDACYRALAFAPAALDLHLAFVDLYVAHGWRAAAAEKLLLLGRLAELEADADGLRRICEVVAERFADDERLIAACG